MINQLKERMTQLLRLNEENDQLWKELPVIALTADILTENREKLMELGINDVLNKPIQPELLFHQIDCWVK